MSSWFVKPETRRLELPEGQWLVVKKRLTEGERRQVMSGMVSEMVRYPDAGYWVSYSVIPGDEPVTIVTIRKMQ